MDIRSYTSITLTVIFLILILFVGPILFHKPIEPIKPEPEPVSIFKEELQPLSQLQLEYAYFYGHRDAINDNIIIKRISDSVWIWLESPWTDKTKVINDTLYDFKETL